MTSCQPYILRAIYQWIVDNNLTPFVTVDANYLESDIADHHAKDGMIVFNVSPSAVRDLSISDEGFNFRTHFDGKEAIISAPVDAVVAIYAKEDQTATIIFSQQVATTPEAPLNKKASKPDLKLVK